MMCPDVGKKTLSEAASRAARRRRFEAACHVVEGTPVVDLLLLLRQCTKLKRGRDPSSAVKVVVDAAVVESCSVSSAPDVGKVKKMRRNVSEGNEQVIDLPDANVAVQ